MSDNQDIDMDRLEQACEELMLHFDSCQIFVTRQMDHEDSQEGTVSATFGGGNWFARKGQISEWLLKAEERSRMEVREEED